MMNAYVIAGLLVVVSILLCGIGYPISNFARHHEKRLSRNQEIHEHYFGEHDIASQLPRSEPTPAENDDDLERVVFDYMISAVKSMPIISIPDEKPVVNHSREKIIAKPVVSRPRMTFVEKREWDEIERLNNGLGVNRDKCYVDERGYLRWNSNNRLVHRDVAYNMIYKKSGGRYPLPFSAYDVHHINQEKWDCQPENLQILTRKTHQQEHD